MANPYANPEESQAVMGQPASQAQMLVERMIEARQLDEQGISPGKYAQGLYQIAVELAEQRALLLQVAHDFSEAMEERAMLCECGETDCRTSRMRAAIARAEGGAA